MLVTLLTRDGIWTVTGAGVHSDIESGTDYDTYTVTNGSETLTVAQSVCSDYTDTGIITRVAAGIRYLDSVLGSDWEDGVDLDTLDISTSTYCVAGQIFPGGYEALMDHLDLDERVACGFTGPSSHMEALTAEWKRAIGQLISDRKETASDYATHYAL